MISYIFYFATEPVRLNTNNEPAAKITDADRYVINKYGNDIKFIRESGRVFYYEVTTLWKGKSTIKVKDGLFGWSDEDL